ncbi:Tyr recombinase domain-containing protein [Durusdinium trenchii]|uniref:Tyr recombinase domain-containing protein n=1 Tax=Durusdinium trenchii TaxID=1381693 RepID=A0ABP0HPK5_9DINO
MVRWRWLLVGLGWLGSGRSWWQGPGVEDVPQQNQTVCWDDPYHCLQLRVNTTYAAIQNQYAALTTWDSVVWSILDTLLSGAGWMVFGQSWTSVRTGCSMILRVATLMAICLILHYFLSLAWPLCSLLIGTILTMIWIVRACVRCCGRGAFLIQRLTGGVPEMTGANFIGPATGEVPETSELRKLKKGSEDRWVLLRRDGQVVIIKVTENAAIKSSGMYLSFDPESVRGDGPLLLALKGYERVHLCRHDTCPEEGQHFKSYALARQLNPEKFHLMSTAEGAQKTGAKAMGWFFSKAGKAAKKFKDYASESEKEEEVKCCAHLVRWESALGRGCLSESPCQEPASNEGEYLEEDRAGLSGDQDFKLCPKHAVSYLTSRTSLRCRGQGIHLRKKKKEKIDRKEMEKIAYDGGDGMGMINSPDRRGEMTYLEEFMEQLADGKELQLNEEDIRKQMAAQSGLTVGDLTKFLYEQATEEQRKGTKGLTKFLAKWRKQAAAQEGAPPSTPSDWSIIERERESSAPTPTSAASGGRVAQSPGSVTVETPPKKKLAVIPPPGIYDPDRKAGTGPDGRGTNPEMTDIARAIQQQTNELATSGPMSTVPP